MQSVDIKVRYVGDGVHTWSVRQLANSKKKMFWIERGYYLTRICTTAYSHVCRYFDEIMHCFLFSELQVRWSELTP